MSLSALFVRYHTEVKQYSSDAMVALLLIYLFLRHKLHDDESDNLQRSASFYSGGGAVIGCLAPWLSMSSVFVLFGIGIFVALKFWRETAHGVNFCIGF